MAQLISLITEVILEKLLLSVDTLEKTEYKEYKINFEKSSMYIFTDGITEIKNPEGNELGSKGFQNYITKFKDKPNNERLKLIIDNVLGSKYIQKDDLTIVVLDS